MSRRRARCVRCSSASPSSSRVSSAIRSRILRRSSSRLDSPAPLPPMPPPPPALPLAPDAAALAVLPLAGLAQPRRQVLQVDDLDLGLRRARAGVAAEDLEDH